MFGDGNFTRLYKEYSEYYKRGKDEKTITEPMNLAGLIVLIFISVSIAAVSAAFKRNFSVAVLVIVMIITISVIPIVIAYHFYTKKRWDKTQRMIIRKGTVKYDCAIEETGWKYSAEGKNGGRKIVFKFTYDIDGVTEKDMIYIRIAGRFYKININDAKITVYESADKDMVIIVNIPGMGEYRVLAADARGAA